MKKKPKVAEPAPMTDRERILIHVIACLHSSIMGRCDLKGAMFRKELAHDPTMDRDHVHFVYYREPAPGDLVLGMSRNGGVFQIAWYVEKLPSDIGGAVVRAIGSHLLCNYRNETFVPIVGMHPNDLLEGDAYAFYKKVHRAFARHDQYPYKYGGCEIDGNVAIISIRAPAGWDSESFCFQMKWNRYTSVTDIIDHMVAAGYGTHEFVRKPATAAGAAL